MPVVVTCFALSLGWRDVGTHLGAGESLVAGCS